ncbi:MAG: class I SAM-dependent methyltransferase [Patescibacteria group bacterium]
MKRIKDEYLNLIEEIVLLEGKDILEIGGGNGSRTIQIAKKSQNIVSIEPNPELVEFAQRNNSASNIKYLVGKAESLDFPDQSFDVVIFTLSLHHVPVEKMIDALNEAVRVVKKAGYIVFLEPAEKGTFFEAEIEFDACDGDERESKKAAHAAIKDFKKWEEIAELSDETVFQFESVEDFVHNLHPKKNLEKVESFLKNNNFILRASRRINIFKL